MAKTCSTCYFFQAGNSTCHYEAPRDVRGAQAASVIWPTCQPTDWCGKWSVDGVPVVNVINPPGPKWTTSPDLPTGGNPGDFHLQVTTSLVVTVWTKRDVWDVVCHWNALP